MANYQNGTTGITEIEDNDILLVGRPSAASGQKDKSISGFNLKAQINTVANGTWSEKTTVTTATDFIGVGAVASYTGFKIQFTINDGTNTTIGEIFLVYTNSTEKAYSPELYGDVEITYDGVSAVKIEQCEEISGQM